MAGNINRKMIIFFISTSAVGFCLYIGCFSYYLIKTGTNPLIVSSLIGSTALTSLFWGPVAGKIIDGTNYKFSFLAAAQIICGLCVFGFGMLDDFNYLLTPFLVITFSLCLNLALIVVNQYLIPNLSDDYEIAITTTSKLTGGIVFLSGIFLAYFYNKINTSSILVISSAAYFISAIACIHFISRTKNLYEPNLNNPPASNSGRNIRIIYKESLDLICKNWFLALSICIFAFTETSFLTNFDVIAFSLGATPYAFVFLMGAISGMIDSIASWLYPKLLQNRTLNFKWCFFLAISFLIYSSSALLAFNGFDKKNLWFIPMLVITLDFIGVWWSIFSSANVREASSQGSYGQTMAAFRVPRSLVTFLGVTSIGTALQTGNLWFILAFDLLLIIMLMVFYKRFSLNKLYRTTDFNNV